MSARIVATAALIASKVAIAAVIVVGIATGLSAHAHAFSSYPPCSSYPGPMPDALCTWIDPRTGDAYVDGPDAMVRCVNEDGNTDGLPCVWWSPRTGLPWFNDGSNYR